MNDQNQVIERKYINIGGVDYPYIPLGGNEFTHCTCGAKRVDHEDLGILGTGGIVQRGKRGLIVKCEVFESAGVIKGSIV